MLCSFQMFLGICKPATNNYNRMILCQVLLGSEYTCPLLGLSALAGGDLLDK